MYAASLVLLGAAAVTLALGVQAEGLGLLYVSIACSALAWVAVSLALLRRLRRPRAP
ncbi:MAG TPA: hypothetical protein VGR49_08185 [Actinomycetota bacterium]|nr:hypothetical protein [Actinomycetota bacterium]